MKQTVTVLVALVLTAVLLGCGAVGKVAEGEAALPTAMAAANEPAAAQTTPVPAAAATQAPAAQGDAPAAVTGSVEGTVLAIADNDITVNLTNGNTINFMMSNIPATDAVIGDKVTIEYSGDVANRPEAVSITVTEKSPAQTLTGTVFMHDATSIFVVISSQQVFGFVLNQDTVITGAVDYVVVGDTVVLTYDGDLYDVPTAVQINVTEAVRDRTEKTAAPQEDPVDKTLDGYVTNVTAAKLTIRTSLNKTYSFKLGGSTRVTGPYTLTTGARVTVYYDGYATKTPLAKAVYVYAPANPNPTATPAPSTKTANGYVDSFGGMYLQLTSGIGFDCAYATYSGNSDGQPGDQARVSYYTGSDGMNYATYITFTAVTPAPTPIPEPTSVPTRSTIGFVTYFGGMYLSLDNGMGFDCAYASYSGDGARLPGDEAHVYYYVGSDGMNYATHIEFSTVYEADPGSEPYWEPEWEEEDPGSEPYWDPDAVG